MPSLDYIEKLTGIKEEWIQNLKETESALVLAVQLPPQEHICPHCKATTRRIKGYYTRLIKHSRATIRASSNIPHFSIKSCISCIARGAIYAAVVTQLTRRAPLPLRISKPLPRFNKSCSRSCVNTFLSKKWPDDAMSAPARSFVSLMKSIFLVPVTFPACFPSMNVKEMLPVRSTKSSSLTLKTSV